MNFFKLLDLGGFNIILYINLYLFFNLFSKDSCVAVTPQIKELTANSFAICLTALCAAVVTESRNILMSSAIHFV